MNLNRPWLSSALGSSVKSKHEAPMIENANTNLNYAFTFFSLEEVLGSAKCIPFKKFAALT